MKLFIRIEVGTNDDGKVRKIFDSETLEPPHSYAKPLIKTQPPFHYCFIPWKKPSRMANMNGPARHNLHFRQGMPRTRIKTARHCSNCGERDIDHAVEPLETGSLSFQATPSLYFLPLGECHPLDVPSSPDLFPEASTKEGSISFFSRSLLSLECHSVIRLRFVQDELKKSCNHAEK